MVTPAGMSFFENWFSIGVHIYQNKTLVFLSQCGATSDPDPQPILLYCQLRKIY
jgi:hypothetical protein